MARIYQQPGQSFVEFATEILETEEGDGWQWLFGEHGHAVGGVFNGYRVIYPGGNYNQKELIKNNPKAALDWLGY